jgi:hypothetical protein
LLRKKAEEFKEPAPKEVKEKPVNVFSEFGFTEGTKAGEDGKPAKVKINMCTCGASDP